MSAGAPSAISEDLILAEQQHTAQRLQISRLLLLQLLQLTATVKAGPENSNGWLYLLQEYLQGHKFALPKYIVVATQGEAHAQVFQVECVIAQPKMTTRGEGNSRRTAEQVAADAAYRKIIST